MARYELAQLNIAHLLEPIDSPALADFVDNLERINALAESSEGFIWRLVGDAVDVQPDVAAGAGDATTVTHGFGDDVIVNLSVWRDVDALHRYVYRSAHAKIMARRKEWFHRMRDAWTVLWWVPAGHRPDVTEAAERLACLRDAGPGPTAFTFKQAYPAPDAAGDRAGTDPAAPSLFDDECPAW